MAPTDEETALPEPATGERGKGETPAQGNSNIGIIALVALVVVGAIIAVVVVVVGKDNDESRAVVPPTEFVGMNFNRISNFPACLQFDATCNFDNETVAEIISASEDGNTLFYTDGAQESLGFIDITDPSNPKALGVVNVGGEPTSTAVLGPYALVCVNTSPNYTNPSGIFHVIDIETRAVLRTGDLGGQPDSIAISPDGKFAAIVIENERDEDFEDGVIPQLPAGFMQVMDTSSDNVDEWTLSVVDLTGLDGALYPSDPEPEYVAINADNIAAVTLQENNAIVLIDLATGAILKSFSAGTVDLEGIDIAEDGIIDQTGSLPGTLREPDAIAWIGTEHLAVANEGDLDGGSRTITIFDTEGNVVYDSGSELEDWATRLGYYPESRSDSKGAEPETVRYSEFGDEKLLFVASERASIIFVYDVADVTAPVLKQVLPAGGTSPEGLCTIPSRNLLVAANEYDSREDVLRAGVTIFELQEAEAVFPTLWSALDEATGKFIPFSALSGLAASGSTLFSVEDAFYKSSRMFVIDTETTPATVVSAVRIVDSNDVLLGALTSNETAILLNDDKTVNLDLEGIDLVGDEPAAGFWVVSEGAGSVDDVERPLETPNLLVRVTEVGVIEEVIKLPDEVNAIQVRYGFEGVAVDGDNILVAFQRAWVNETNVRLGIFNTGTSSWKFVMYPLDEPESQFGGWVGLSDVESLGEGVFLVLERDNQGGPDAAVKRIYKIDLGDFSAEEGTVVEKTLYRDLMPDLKSFNGLVVEKVEGLTVDGSGNLWVNNDNDGVDDNSGEQLLLNLGSV